MAIEAMETIAGSREAYQGSVPKADSKVSDKSSREQKKSFGAVAKAQEASALTKPEKYMPVATGKKPAEKNETKDPAEGAERPAGNEARRKAVDEINRHITNSEVVFGIHDKTNRVTIKIVDKDSKKVLKEYPPEQTLDTIAKIWELAGIMVDEKG